MKRSYTHRAAFTLVELLTVIIIIGFLAGMVAGTAPAVMRSVKASAIRAEIQQLSLALEAYKAEYGEYPPDGSGNTVSRHLSRCYPDIDLKNATIPSVTPSTALYIFLGPHSAKPSNPFGSSDTLTKGFFEFEKSRLSGNSYLPSGCTEPYCYVKATGATGNKTYKQTAYAYYDKEKKDGNEIPIYYNENTYQIMSAGLDDEWGSSRCIIDKTEPDNPVQISEKAALDNIVNFGKKTIKDLLD